MSPTLFLRRVLALDAASCLLMGVLLVLGAGTLAPMFGLPEPLVRTAGYLLVPLGLFFGWLASRAEPPRPLVWIVILGNIAWGAESFLVNGQHDPSALGTAFVAAQALAVLGLAGLEYMGLRRARALA